ncbi:uncharacterized protein A1O5_11854 [Cladophialophora psammophila CBS 110553]|uniref:MalT-like TPR region domain-containing protein n=1 Tax=Cladophialophora psammophila CBS 110553 TaxID=1182543 RepID=W9VZN1_9EURO|nr:uncharacterized protein A1O5_11854 [Cladophialophora psammophila CBS 110553]EXJ61297.1 hypothetical protein A1O5_11854 [Cladophialophora psammophila CBS 110553]
MALSFLEELLHSGDDEQYLGALMCIGNTREVQDRLFPAIETYKRVLEMQTANLGSNHLDPLMSVRRFASLFYRASRYQDALTWENKAVSGFGKLGIDGEVEGCKSLDYLSCVYLPLGRFQDATKVQKKAVEGFEKVLGTQHPSTWKATLDLADIYRAMERKEDAVRLYEKTLKGYEA